MRVTCLAFGLRPLLNARTFRTGRDSATPRSSSASFSCAWRFDIDSSKCKRNEAQLHTYNPNRTKLLHESHRPFRHSDCSQSRCVSTTYTCRKKNIVPHDDKNAAEAKTAPLNSKKTIHSKLDHQSQRAIHYKQKSSQHVSLRGSPAYGSDRPSCLAWSRSFLS